MLHSEVEKTNHHITLKDFPRAHVKICTKIGSNHVWVVLRGVGLLVDRCWWWNLGEMWTGDRNTGRRRWVIVSWYRLGRIAAAVRRWRGLGPRWLCLYSLLRCRLRQSPQLMLIQTACRIRYWTRRHSQLAKPISQFWVVHFPTSHCQRWARAKKVHVGRPHPLLRSRDGEFRFKVHTPKSKKAWLGESA